MDFFDRVKVLARAKNTTIEAVANSAGLTRDSYNSYRKKGNLPRADEALHMADELGTTVEYLVDGRETSLALASSLSTRPALRLLVERLVPRGDEDIIKAIRILDVAIFESARETEGPPFEGQASG
jgi:transcriptional regulator with XRE-family HTH domain